MYNAENQCTSPLVQSALEGGAIRSRYNPGFFLFVQNTFFPVHTFLSQLIPISTTDQYGYVQLPRPPFANEKRKLTEQPEPRLVLSPLLMHRKKERKERKGRKGGREGKAHFPPSLSALTFPLFIPSLLQLGPTSSSPSLSTCIVLESGSCMHVCKKKERARTGGHFHSSQLLFRLLLLSLIFIHLEPPFFTQSLVSSLFPPPHPSTSMHTLISRQLSLALPFYL